MKIRSKTALTFVEVMVALLLFTLIVGGLYTTLLVGQVSFQNFESVVRSQQEVRRTIAVMARDFREAENLKVAMGADNLTIAFHHPKEGNVSYFWSKTGPQAGQVFRQSPAGIRNIARDISDFKVQEVQRIVRFSVTATTISRQGRIITFSMSHRAGRRR